MVKLMKSLNKIYLTVLFLIFSILILQNNVHAYWGTPNTQSSTNNSVIQIGEWIFETIYDDILSLDELSEDELNITIPENTMFIYQGFLYLTRPNSNYNPEYHGLPDGSSSPIWAVWSIELQWKPNTNYRTHSIVIRNGRYFIANSNYNQDWFVGDPLDSENNSWAEWREIEPVSEDMFDYFYDTQIKDYRLNPNQVIYK